MICGLKCRNIDKYIITKNITVYIYNQYILIYCIQFYVKSIAIY